jgi:hypothetical protein
MGVPSNRCGKKAGTGILIALFVGNLFLDLPESEEFVVTIRRTISRTTLDPIEKSV